MSQADPTVRGQVLVVWLFAFSYFFVISLLGYLAGGSGGSQIPSSFSVGLAVSYALNLLLGFVPVFLFLVLFVRRYEKKGSVASTVASLGVNRRGIEKSLFWIVPFFFLLIVVIEAWASAAQALFGPSITTALSRATGIPQWYSLLSIISAQLNALMEEALGRGYLLDRLMPCHPASLASSLPAVLAVSGLGTLYHIGPYLFSYRFSPPSALYNLVIVFLSFTFVGLSYVRSRVRNVSGPILAHFLLDALPFIYVLLV